MVLKADGTVMAGGNIGLPDGLANVVAISSVWDFCLALKCDGTVVAWGDNSSGQTNVPIGLTNVVAIAAGYDHALALKADGSIVGWGDNANGEITSPIGLTNVVSIAAGDGNSVAIIGDNPPVLQGLISSPACDTSGFSVALSTQNGRVYRMEYKNSLTDSDWTALPLVAGNGKILRLTDSSATNSPRFYRVMRW
jgi:hypothetical protein